MRTQFVLFAAVSLASVLWAQEPGPDAVFIHREVQAIPHDIGYGPAVADTGTLNRASSWPAWDAEPWRPSSNCST